MSANRSRVGWFTVVGFFGLVGGGVVLMNQETSTPQPQIAPVVSPQVVYPQPVMPAYPTSPQLLRPVYPDRSAPLVYPEHDASKYDSHDHERERR
jgi:hypothetical protein